MDSGIDERPRLDLPHNSWYNHLMKTYTPKRRRRVTQVVDALRQGIRQRSKSWSKNGRFATAQDERRRFKAAIRTGDWE